MKQVAPRTIFGLFDPNRLKLTFPDFQMLPSITAFLKGKLNVTFQRSSRVLYILKQTYTYKIKNDKGKLVNAILKLVGNTAEKDV